MQNLFKPGDKVQFVDKKGDICLSQIYYYQFDTDIHDVKHGDVKFQTNNNIGTVIRIDNLVVVVEFIDRHGAEIRLGFNPVYLRPIQIYQKTVTIIDWEMVPLGTFFEWGQTVGRINIVGNYFYFCSDTKSGINEKRRWGYKYSYGISKKELENYFKNIQIILSDVCPEGHIVPDDIEENFHTDMAGYTPIICRGNVKFGCQTIPNSLIRELVSSLRD